MARAEVDLLEATREPIAVACVWHLMNETDFVRQQARHVRKCVGRHLNNWRTKLIFLKKERENKNKIFKMEEFY
jgi:hypothetical protein